jgi:phosphatidate cytidylyltransferase
LKITAIVTGDLAGYPTALKLIQMLAKRFATLIILIPAVVLLLSLGGWFYFALAFAFLMVGAWEYWNLFRIGGFAPSLPILLVGTATMAFMRHLWGFAYADVALGLLVIIAMGWHVFAYERGDQHSGTDFAITLGGVLYLGWLGSYLISIRSLPDGTYWFMTALPAIWFGDGGAFFIGRSFGKHKISKRVSPNKSWEGYLAGIVVGTLFTAGLAALWHLVASEITVLRGAVIGLVVSILSPLGDFGESLFKRQFNVKDSSNLIPGHGGVLDRIDTSLWAALIGYYLITWLW